MVRAKFKCTEKCQQNWGGGDSYKVVLDPVTGGNDENQRFFRATPSGRVELGGLRPETAEAFVPGKSYYVDFTPADA